MQKGCGRLLDPTCVHSTHAPSAFLSGSSHLKVSGEFRVESDFSNCSGKKEIHSEALPYLCAGVAFGCASVLT